MKQDAHGTKLEHHHSKRVETTVAVDFTITQFLFFCLRKTLNKEFTTVQKVISNKFQTLILSHTTSKVHF